MKQTTCQVRLSQFELCKLIYQSKIMSEIKLSPSTKLVLIGLANHFNPSKDDMFPSQNYLSQHLGISVKSIQRAITELSQNGLVVYDTKTVNHYVFTKKFFNLIQPQETFSCPDKMSDDKRQIVSNGGVKLSHKHTQEHEKNKVKDFNKFRKESGRQPYYSYSKQNEGMNIKSVEQTKELMRQTFEIETKSPMDDLQTAKNWLNALSENELKHSFIEEKALKIRRRWNL